MQLFANTVDVRQLRRLVEFVAVDGVTMNPTMIAAARIADLHGLIRDVLSVIAGSVLVPVLCDTVESAYAEGTLLGLLSHRVCLKVPCTQVGLQAIRRLSGEGIRCNATLCFSPVQALLAHKAGAESVSIFLNRLNATGRNGTAILSSIVSTIRAHKLSLQTVAASLKDADDVQAAIEAGVDAVTLTTDEWLSYFDDPLSIAGAEVFDRDWGNFVGSRSPSNST